MTQRTDGQADSPLTGRISVSPTPSRLPTTGGPIEWGKFNLKLEDLIGHPKPGDFGIVPPEFLYEVRPGRVTSSVSDEIAVLTIRRVCDEALRHLEQALEEKDVIVRETTMTLFNDVTFRLGHFVTVDQNFQRAISLLHTAIISSLASVYEERQILGLRKFIRLMKDNVYMRDEIIRDCIRILGQESGFDLGAPTAEADFYGDDGERKT